MYLGFYNHIHTNYKNNFTAVADRIMDMRPLVKYQPVALNYYEENVEISIKFCQYVRFQASNFVYSFPNINFSQKLDFFHFLGEREEESKQIWPKIYFSDDVNIILLCTVE